MLLCCGALWAALAAAPLRAQIRIVPRAKLDSLAHPATAAGGAEAMRFERTLIDAGHIGEDDVPPVYTFRWRNTGGKPLVVTRVQTTCGCAAASWDKKPVAPGGEGAVTVTYRPKGHPGVFDRRIFVYTQLSDKEPTAILSLRGAVTASVRTDDDYPHAMGALRPHGQGAERAYRVPECGRQTAHPGLRRRIRGHRPELRLRTGDAGTRHKRRSGRPLRPGQSPAAAPADSPAGRGTGRAAEPAHAVDRVRGNRIRNRIKTSHMKRFLRFAALLSALALLGACDDDMYVTPLEVTNNNIAGTWQLAEWNGAPLAEGSFVYIEFIRKDAKYVMYQNLDSFGTRKLTGRFVIDNDAELGAVIRGSYDYGAGDWAHRYIVTDFTETSMVWTAKDDRSDVQVFVRCDGIPDEVTGGKTEE